MKTKAYLSTFWLWSLLLLIASCSEDNQTMPGLETDQALVAFTAEMENGYGLTKATDTAWETGDAIGVFMTQAGMGLDAAHIIGEANNRKYATPSTDGKFLPAKGESILYPEDGSKVDFYAYYPYQGNLNNFQIAVDVTSQANPAALDLMVADNVKGARKGNDNRLLFKRQLACLMLNVSAGKGVESLHGLTVTLTGMPAKATFNLANNTLETDAKSVADIALSTQQTTTGMSAKAIILPVDSWKNATLVFTLGGKAYPVKMESAKALKAGERLTYNVTLQNSGGTINPDPNPTGAATWFETPVLTSGNDLEYITHYMPDDKHVRNYSMLYDKKNKLSYWVAYPLHPYYIGSAKRTDDWQWDPAIDAQWQPCLFKGFGTYNIDRGHQIPSADRTSSSAANATTFYFTNMTAQVGRGLNQNIWADLESQIRSWMHECDTLYVVTGAMITTATDKTIAYVTDNNKEKVAKPKYYYKALCKKKGKNYYTIGFRFDNKQYSVSNNNDFTPYQVTVSALEEETGFTFFPQLPADVKGKIDKAQW